MAWKEGLEPERESSHTEEVSTLEEIDVDTGSLAAEGDFAGGFVESWGSCGA